MREKKPQWKSPLTKGVIKFFAIWHFSLNIPILFSLLLPWIDGANFFELAFRQSQNILLVDRAFTAGIALFALFGVNLGIPEILCISAAFDHNLVQAQRKLHHACIVFIPIPLIFLGLGLTLWGIYGTPGCGGQLFVLILWPIYSFIALVYIIFLIIADILKFFPKEQV